MSKDLSLLRPFDLEKAKQGEPICTNYESSCRFIGILSTNKIVIEDTHTSYNYPQSQLRMAPLCWIEDKPVYKGDTLYIKDINQTDIVIGIHPNRNEFLSFKETGACYKDNRNNTLSWTKPKQKKQGWVNVYKDGESFWYNSQAEANDSAMEDRIVCIPFKYEE